MTEAAAGLDGAGWAAARGFGPGGGHSIQPQPASSSNPAARA